MAAFGVDDEYEHVLHKFICMRRFNGEDVKMPFKNVEKDVCVPFKQTVGEICNAVFILLECIEIASVKICNPFLLTGEVVHRPSAEEFFWLEASQTPRHFRRRADSENELPYV